MNASIYLDHNATTPLRPEAAAAIAEAMKIGGNPSSVHAAGRRARRAIEDSREQVAALVGAEPAQVIFTSGGTEANAQALRGSGRWRTLISAVEHVSVRGAIDGATVVPVDSDGIIRIDALAGLLAASDVPALVSVMLANNETGVIQPIAEVAAVCRRHGAMLHCDAVQAAGRVALDMRDLGVHMLSLSAHKLGGPAGCGALVVEAAVPLQALLRGSGQERGRRSGTENVIGIAGFGAAAERARGLQDAGRLAMLRDRLERRLQSMYPAAQVFGATAPRLPNTACIAMPGVAAETQVIAFDLAGIAVSAGAACSSGRVTRSGVLAAMGVGDDLASTAIRVSLGWTTGETDVERFIEVWPSVYARGHSRGAAFTEGQAAAEVSRVVSER
ncbi:MAG TPA: cysteine desulfurase family protein [Rhodospirillales bacterium]|nr:cysteine desulfurase family protein [Rhodospirillales bacterium]